jgi:predicted aldo/keto reductase-like oxidoreductase
MGGKISYLAQELTIEYAKRFLFNHIAIFVVSVGIGKRR